MKGRRIERVESLLREEISRIVMMEIKDPRIGMVTISEVSVAPDLRSARVYYSFLGERGEEERVDRGLKSASGYIYYRLKKTLNMRIIPALSFKYRETGAEGLPSGGMGDV